MQESSWGADHGSDSYFHVFVHAGKSFKACSHLPDQVLVRWHALLSPESSACAGLRAVVRGSSACQRPADLPVLRVAYRYSPVGFDRQQIGAGVGTADRQEGFSED